MNQELVEYIKKARESGQGIEQIKLILLNAGYTKEVIDALLELEFKIEGTKTIQSGGQIKLNPSGVGLDRFRYAMFGSFVLGVIGLFVSIISFFILKEIEFGGFILAWVLLVALIALPVFGFVFAFITYKNRGKNLFLNKPKWWMIPITIILIIFLYKLFNACFVDKLYAVCSFTYTPTILEKKKQLEFSNLKPSSEITYQYEGYVNGNLKFSFNYPSHYLLSNKEFVTGGSVIASDYAKIYIEDITGLPEVSGERIGEYGEIKFIKLPLSGNRDGGIEYEVRLTNFPETGKYFRILFTTTKPGFDNKVEEFKEIFSTFTIY